MTSWFRSHFHYSSVDDAVAISFANCWYGKLDLSNCFLSFPLHPSACKYFIFSFDDTFYQFRRMPFGLATAPYDCTLILSVVAFALVEAGINALVRYIDDFLFIAESAQELERSLIVGQDVFSQFGLVVNTKKTEGPAQRISFLGIVLDSLETTLSCTEERLSELTELLSALRGKRLVQCKRVRSLIGKLSFAAMVLPGARPFMRRLLDSVSRCKTRNTPIPLTEGMLADIDFWLEYMRTWNGKQRWRSSRDVAIHFATDASLTGFGFHVRHVPAHIDATAWPAQLAPGVGHSGLYDPSHKQYHSSHTLIGWCELLAVYACARTYAHLLRDQTVIFHVDNQGDTFIINRQATRSPVLAGILRELYRLAVEYNISISAQHIRGTDNTLADFLSRPELHEHNHLQRWRDTHPSLGVQLSSVCVVSSLQFVNSESKPQSSSSFPSRTQ
jgi:hypothetical protein